MTINRLFYLLSDDSFDTWHWILTKIKKKLIFRIQTVVVTEQLFWPSVMRNRPVFDQKRLNWQNLIVYYKNSESFRWGGSNDVYILWLLIKFNETTFSGQLWPLFLTVSGQNDIDGWRSIQIWNPHVETVLTMCISCDFW